MKKKRIRAIRSAAIAFVILAVVVIVGAMLATSIAVKTVVEKAGVKTLNVGVEIDHARASLLSGSACLQEIRVANPEGYQGPSLLTLKSVDVDADTGTLLSDKFIIRTMHLEGMEIFIEQNGLRNNLYEVIEPLQRPREATGKAMLIEQLTIGQVVVHVAMPSLTGSSQARTMDLKVEPITMTDLGRNEPMDTTLLITKVVLAVAAGVADQSGDILPKETVSEISNVLDKAIDIGRILFGGKKDK